ncbi:MAG: hypothetical protein EBS53_10640, partial [Bacteroidetes bacterium]|nr:hypothetical protein [Bacteroidota bacterium]
MKKNLLLVVLLFLSSLQIHLKAQSINTTLGTVTGVCVGDTVVVPVTVTMASGISTSAISLSIDYDTTKLRCISSVTSINSNIATGFLSNCGLFSNLNPGTGPFTPTTRRQFRAAWFALTPVAFNGLMFNLRFVALASTTGSSPIAWDIATMSNCEYADEFADVIPNCTFVNGSVTIDAPAAITAQPSGNTSITAGGNTSFSVVANGNPTYRWQQLTAGGSWTNLSNGSFFGGVTTGTLTITAATTSLNGNQYRVIVTGGCGAPVTSNALTLSVTSASATGLTAGNANGCQGDTVLVPLSVSGLNAATAFSFKINLPSGATYVGLANVVGGLSSATGSVASGLLTINWSGSAFTQASGTLMNIRLVLGTQGGTLAWDNATSVNPNSTLSFTNGTLGVTALPIVVTQPVAALTVAEFLGTSISAVTNNATSFRWQKQDVGSSIWNDLSDNNIYSGTGTAVLNISSASLSLNGARYRLRMSAVTCPAQVNSGVCTLTVTPMQITLNALGANACAGDTVTIPVRVSGANAISNMSVYLIYSASNLTFLPALSDSLLNANISVQAITSPTPRIFISYNAGPSINMNQTTLVRLRFRALGSSPLTWSNNSDFSNSIGDAVALTQITGVSSNVSVAEAVVTAAGSTSFCTGGSVVLNGNTIAGATYQWLNASGPIAGATNASYTATTAGNYRFAVAVAGACSDTSAPVTVTTSAPPVAGLLNGNQSICVNGTTTFGSTVAGGIWSSDNPVVATVVTSTGVISGISPGTVTITYTVPGTGGCANATATRSVTVTAPPTAGDLSGNQFICVAGTTTFTSTVSGGTWSSSASGVASINDSTGLVTGVSAGTATMTYTVTDTGGCANGTATRTLTVTAPPSAGTLSGNQAVCVASTTTFTSTVSGGTWSSSNTAVA